MKMGFLPPMILLLFILLFVMLLPLFLAKIFPEFDWILKAYFSIIIFSFVRRILGGGIMTYIVSGILIYIFVFQLFWLFTPAYMLFLIVGLGLSGIIVFGLPGRGMGRRSGVARQ